MRTNGRDRGATLPIVALLLPVLIVMTAFAVDLGQLRSSRRTMQARADVIALDLVRLTGIASWNGIISDAGYTAYWQESASRNAIDPSKLTIVWGSWTEATGFQACTVLADCTGPGTIPTAVKVTAQESTKYFFQPGSGNATRTAIAATDAIAGFQVGSRLVSIDTAQSAILNQVFAQALGASPALNAVAYQGLLNATIPLGPLATALNLGSPEALAGATVGAKQFYQASAQVMQNQGNTAAANALGVMGASTNNNLLLNMGKLMTVEQGGAAAAANASVDLYSLVTGSAFAINGTNTISIPALTIGVPGASTDVTLSVIEKPRFNFGREGVTTVTTEQATLGLITTVTNIALPVPGLTGATTSGTIPLSLGLAGATGTLTNIECGRPGIDVGLTPQPLTVTGGVDLTVSAIVGVATVPVATANVPASSPIEVTGTSSGASFLYKSEFLPQVGTGTMKPSPTNTLTLPGPLTLTSGKITALGVVPLDLAVLAAVLNTSVINPVTTAVSGVITTQLNQLLGLDINGADIGALDMECESVKLVG